VERGINPWIVTGLRQRLRTQNADQCAGHHDAHKHRGHAQECRLQEERAVAVDGLDSGQDVGRKVAHGFFGQRFPEQANQLAILIILSAQEVQVAACAS